MRRRIDWDIPPRLWAFLSTATVAIGLIFVLLSLDTWLDERENAKRDAELRRVLCELTVGLAGGPTPPPGPTGDRARALIPKMDAMREEACRKP